MYHEYADGSDSNGHGTHVTGTLVGSPYTMKSAEAEYRGMAPEARVAFIDLGDVGVSTSELIKTPPDLHSSYFPLAYKRGARVHSDSWSS